MNKILNLFLSSFLIFLGSCSFESPREQAALPSTLETLLQHGQITQEQEQLEVFFRAFKQEEVLEVWGRLAEQDFRLLATYPFCANSGKLGPKRQKGDLQIPEGCYEINRFNPNSRFYLSLGLNYPNASDLKRSDPRQPGGDIFIHGGCASVGCISITDAFIQPVYELASRAHRLGQQRILVHIFPSKNWKHLFRNNNVHHTFWRELQPIHDFFERYKQLPTVPINARGAYSLG